MKTFTISFFIILLGCSVFDSEQNLEDAEVLATANDPVFSVLNKTRQSVYFLVLDVREAALFDPAPGFPCSDFQPNLLSKESIQIAYADIMGWDKNAESVWFMWSDCQGSGDSKTIKL